MQVRRVLPNLALVIASVVTPILAAEGLLRLTRYRAVLAVSMAEPVRYFLRPDREKGYDIQENFPRTAVCLSSREMFYDIWSNELGCFDEPYHGEKDYILIVGDSFTQGYCPFEAKWGTLLQGRLGIRVIKCGVQGYGTRQELLKAKDVVRRIGRPPRLIILGYSPNDVLDDYCFLAYSIIDGYPLEAVTTVDGRCVPVSQEELASRYRLWRQFGVPEHPRSPHIQRVKWWLQRYSVAYGLARTVTRKVALRVPLAQRLGIVGPDAAAPGPPFYDDPSLQRAYAEHLRNLDELKDFSNRCGADLLVLMIPAKEQVYPFLAQSAAHLDLYRPNRIIGEWLRNSGVRGIDLLPSFREFGNLTTRRELDPARDLYWRYDGHWNPRGNRLAALLLARTILRWDVLPIQDRIGRLVAVNAELARFKR